MGSKSSKSAPQLRLKLSVAQQMQQRDETRTRYSKSRDRLTEVFNANGDLSSVSLTPPDSALRVPASSPPLPSHNPPSVTFIEVHRRHGKTALRSLTRHSQASNISTAETISMSPRCYDSFSASAKGGISGISDLSGSPRASFVERRRGSMLETRINRDVEALFVEKPPRKSKNLTVTYKKALFRRKKTEECTAKPPNRPILRFDRDSSLIPFIRDAAGITPTSPNPRFNRKSGVNFIFPGSTPHPPSNLSAFHQFLTRLENRETGQGSAKTYKPRKNTIDGESPIRRLSALLEMANGERSSRAEKRWRWKGAYGQGKKGEK